MHRNDNVQMGRREWVLILILSLLWGASFFYFKILVAEFPPFTVVLGRLGIAALALNAVLLLRRDRMPKEPRIWGGFLVMALLNNIVPFSLIAFGEIRISSGLASILNATTPIFTVLAAHALTSNEKLTWAKTVGVAFGFLGVAVLIGPSVLSGLGQGDMAGEIACLLASLVYALGAVYGRRFRGIAPLKIATGQITAGTVLLIPIALLVDHPWLLSPPSPEAWAAWSGMALLSTALAYMLYFRLFAVAGATNSQLVTFLVPISALLLATLFLGERISLRSIGGMALIGLGLAAIDGRLWRAVALRVSGAPVAETTARSDI